MQKHGAVLGGKALAEGMAELASLARRAAAEEAMLDKELDAATLDALAKGTSPRAVAETGGRLRAARAGWPARLARLHKAGLIDRDALSRCKAAGECDGAALEAYLKKNGCQGLCDGLAACNRPGQGGVSRGQARPN